MKRSLRSFKRRYMTRRTIDAPKTALFWWGSDGFAGGPTIGDVMAVENLSSSLATAGIPNAIVSHPELGLTGHLAADDIYAIKRVERLAFVCGPITDNRNLRDLLASQRSARKIAVGVSVLPNHERMNRRFDRIVARDGLQDSYFDLAPATAAVPRYDPSFSRVGLCLRGPQSEYGRSRPEQSAKAAEIFAQLLPGRDVIEIDTVLSPTNSMKSISDAFASCDLVLTTRMHGGLLALAAGKPVIAIDQISGGAKVSAVLGRTGWPYVFEVQTVTADIVAQALAELQISAVRQHIAASQTRMVELTRRALAAGVEAVKRS